MRHLMISALKAKRWLSAVEAKDKKAEALREFGILLCNQIRSRTKELLGMEGEPTSLPCPNTFVNLERSELLQITQAITLSPLGSWQATESERQTWAVVIGGLALSYARSSDVSVVAALVRAAAHLDLKGPWLSDAQYYLLDQQQPDGSFGLLAPEVALLGEGVSIPDALIRLTVEVLWAITEVAAGQHRSL